jgi:uncharacterized protein (TIGR00725 family)
MIRRQTRRIRSGMCWDDLVERTYIAVVGPGAGATSGDLQSAREVGAALARAGAVVLTGGHGGVMQAAAAGAREQGGTSIGILPERDRAQANPDLTFTIPTGLGELRNGLLVRAADAVICIALSWGTLSEVALAVRTGVPVITLGDLGLPLAGPVAADGPDQAVRLALDAAADRPGGSGRTSDALDLAAPPVHHLTLSVTDVRRSADWYQDLLGPASVIERTGPDWERIRMQWPSGLVVGVTAHNSTESGDRFDHRRVGMDHVGLACTDRAEVRRWAERLDAIGAPRGPVEDLPYGWAVTGRDPDDIPVEFFAAKQPR